MPLFVSRKIEKLKAAGNIDGLIEAFVHPDTRTRDEALFALTELTIESMSEPDAPVWRGLAEFARDPSRPVDRRTAAIHMLGTARGGGLSLEALVDLLDDDTREDPSNVYTSVRASAIEELAKFREQAFDPLLSHLEKRGADDSLAGSVVESLARWGDEDGLAKKLADKGTVTALAGVLDAPLSPTATLDHPNDAVQALVERIQSFRAAAAHALGKLGGERALTALLGVQTRVKDELRDSGVILHALAALGDPRAIQAIEDVLDRSFPTGPRSDSWWDAARILGQQGNERGRRLLVEALVDRLSSHQSYGARRGAAHELRDKLPWVERYLGAWALSAFRSALMGPTLGSGINWNDEYDSDMDREGRHEAEQAVEEILRRIGTPEALRILDEFGRPDHRQS